MQTAESAFRRWMRCLIILFLIFLAYIIVADRHAPLTTESRVHGYVVQIAPEVSGNVTSVKVKNNQDVKKGELLFTIDDSKYQIAVERAKVNLAQAHEQETALYAQADAAKAQIATAQAAYNNANREYNRIQKLANKNLVSQSMRDNAFAQDKVTRSNLAAAKQQLLVIQAKLGSTPGNSTMVHAAENALKQAELDLSHTQVKAPSNGVITNMQLDEGTMASANKPILTFIPTDNMWVSADFREKATALINDKSAAYVTYDALPGEVFDFKIASRDFGVSSAQQNPNGQLTTVEVNNRWVRDAQRIRVNLVREEPMPKQLFVGSRATVVIYPTENPIWQFMASAEIWIASVFHYIY
ncbi:HlyD family secretion protein [Photobacterium damselae]|uniref:HlyD family secretion protein n=1 Tax=Photobacterium damselae TaxID=38293 RepID=A0ABD6X5E2_PHODM|nr:HlyD family secretion protein [Photobacterium damselae]OBU42526.1 multidrug transporter [Photobacterium damselae]PSU17449.1 HlyD family secretion protein [Photobacterium damselae]